MHKFNWLNINKLNDEDFGVYSIWSRNLCIYVGKAEKQCLKKRLLQHYKGSHNAYLDMWINSSHTLWFSCIVMHNINAIDACERDKIVSLAPLTNITLKKRNINYGKHITSL